MLVVISKNIMPRKYAWELRKFEEMGIVTRVKPSKINALEIITLTTIFADSERSAPRV